MRQLKITRHPHDDTPAGTHEQAGQLEPLLLLWATLGSAGLSPAAAALRPVIEGNARFVVSLAKQYQHHGVSQEMLVTAAHGVLIALLNQHPHHSDKLDKVLPLALRNAMIAAIQASADSPQ